MRKFRVVLLFALLLAIVSLLFVFTRPQGTLDRRESAFALHDTSNVVKIFLADKGGRTVLLERGNNDTWRVNGQFMARKDMTDLLLSTMKNLSVSAPVPKTARNTVISNLASRSVKVEFYQRKYFIDLFHRIRLFPSVKLTREFYIGDITPDNIGTYMIKEGASTPFIVHWPGFRGFVASRFSTLLEDWRDHGVFRFELPQISAIEVSFTENPDQSYRVENKGMGQVELIPHKTGAALPAYDTLRMLAFLTAFNDIRYEALLNDMPQKTIDSIIASPPMHIVTLTDIYGTKHTIRTFHRLAQIRYIIDEGEPADQPFDIERMYASVNNGQDFVLIQNFVFDRILVPLNKFKL